MTEEKEYRIKVEYLNSEPWYNPQVKCKFLWWSYWDSIGNLYRNKDRAEKEVRHHIDMINDPIKTESYTP